MLFTDRWLVQNYRYIGYEECSNVQLVKFINDRSIPDHALEAPDFTDQPIENLLGYKRDLVKMLMKADDERTFTKLFNLPPELRTTIYSFYICDFGKDTKSSGLQALWAPAQPPLAKVSRMLRREVLPVFYNQCRFRITLNQTKNASRRLCFDANSNFFLSNISKEHFKVIRQMEIGFYDESEKNKYFIIRIDLTSTQPTVQAVCARADSTPKRSPAPVKIALDALVGKIHGRDGKLRLEDIYSARNIVESTWKRQK
jgi:hypothetical protein